MTTTARPKVTEAQFQRQVIDLAKLAGWRVFHPRISIQSVPGWPDLVLVRDRILFRELKSESGQTTPEQDAWLAALTAAGADAAVWRPADLETTIRETLTRRPA
jgi:hypothetical protein